MAGSRRAEVLYVGDASDLIRESRRAASAAAKSAAIVSKAAKTVAASSAASSAAIETSTAKTARRIKSMSSTVGGGLRAMSRAAATTAKVAGVGLAVGLGYSLKVAMGFDKQLSSLGAVANATGKQMNGLRQQALKAGADTAFSAQEAAVAQTELAKGGLKAAQILGGGLDAALALAAAGELGLGDAAAYTANAMNLFGIEAKGAGRVADALATAANETTADVSDFGMALTQGGSAAKLAGADFTETMVALESLAKAGIKGSDAGTSLKSFFLKIGNPSVKAKEAMAELNLELFDAQGNLKSMPAISAELQKSFGNLTREQFIQKAGTIAGSDAIRTLWSLYDAGPKKLKGFEDGLSKQGTAAEVGRKKLDNLAGDLEELGGSVETAGIKIGSALTPAARKLVEGFKNEVNRITPAAEETVDDVIAVFKRDDLSLSEKFDKAWAAVEENLGPHFERLKSAFKGLDLGKTLGDLFEKAMSAAMNVLGKAAPKAAGLFVKAFMGAGTWGKLATLGFIAWKFGAFSAAGNMAANRFAVGFVAGSAKIKAAFTAVMAAAAIRGGAAGALAGAAAGGGFLKGLTRAIAPVAIAAIIADAFVNADVAGEDPMKLAAHTKKMRAFRKDAETEFAKVAAAAKKLPASKAIKLLVKHKDALGAVGVSISELKKYGKLREVAKIMASNDDAKSKLAQVTALMDQFYSPRSPAQLRIEGVGAVTSGLQYALDLLNRFNSTPVKKAPQARGASAMAPDTLVQANSNTRALERRFAREDISAERQQLKNRAHLDEGKLTDKSLKGKSGTVLAEAKAHNERNKRIREGRKELRQFNAAQTLSRDRARETGKAMDWVRYFEKAKEQAEGLASALGNVDSSLKGVFSSAVSEFQSSWESGVGAAMDKASAAAQKASDDANTAALNTFDAATSAAIANGPAAKALAALEQEAARVAAEAEDAGNVQSLEDAKRSGDPRAIAAAEAAIVETARQRAITTAQAAAEAERAQIEAQRESERKAVEDQQAAERASLEESQQAARQAAYDADTAAFQKQLWDKLTAEQAMLNAGLTMYADFAAKVNAILAAAGVGGEFVAGAGGGQVQIGGVTFEQSADDAKAIGKGKPKKPAKKKRAVGGGLDYDAVYRVGELGPEDIYMNRAGRPTVLQASESMGGSGGNSGVIQNFNAPVTIGSERAARAMANQWAMRARRG